MCKHYLVGFYGKNGDEFDDRFKAHSIYNFLPVCFYTCVLFVHQRNIVNRNDTH